MKLNISYKTELNEIITLEEVSMLFDNISKKYTLSLVALSLYPDFFQLKHDILSAATKQRNHEISYLLNEITDRKQEIKSEMWEHLNKLGKIKKDVEKNEISQEDIEQLIFEEEQIIDAYEEIICSLEIKEKKIMSGKYPRINKILSISNQKSLKRQFEDLMNNLLTISEKHNDCFERFQPQIRQLIEKSILTANHIVNKIKTKKSLKIDIPSKVANIFETIDNMEDENIYYELSDIVKDFYLYEPNKENLEDELIYQLMNNIDYEDEDGSVNAIVITTDIDE